MPVISGSVEIASGMTGSYGPAPAAPVPVVAKEIGLFDATMLTVGSMVGVGVFMTAGVINDLLGSPILVISIWLAGGLLTLCGAMIYAELCAAMPTAGGEYRYLREAYGEWCGFLHGWISIGVINPGSIALMAVVFASLIRSMFPGLALESAMAHFELSIFHCSVTGTDLLAMTAVAFLSGMNYLGIRQGSMVQNLLTLVKLGAIAGIVLFGMNMNVIPSHMLDSIQNGQMPSRLFLVPGFALMVVFFSYTGWSAPTFVAGEIRDPHRVVPRALILGTLLAIAVHLLLCTPLVTAGDAAAVSGYMVAQPPIETTIVIIAIAGAILGAINSTIITSSRVYFAMATDGLFFAAAGRLHGRYGTPSRAIAIQAIWSCVLICVGDLTELLTFTTVAMIAFSVLTGLVIFILRQSRPLMMRPYRIHGYPWIPGIYVLSCLLILVMVIAYRPRDALAALFMTIVGLGAYVIWRISVQDHGRSKYS